MAGETPLTLVGNIANDVELGFTSGGAAYLNLSIASTPRVFDKNTNEWKDGEPLFLRGTAWRKLAENAADSLQKGSRVIVTGNLKQRSYEKDGEKRTVIEMEITEIGASVQFATVQITKSSSDSGSLRNAAGGGDVWGSPGTANAGMDAPF
ncbi:single-stranded DNA-binding protein [Nocardia sp. NPDC056611]|uniref:single-stranded DNA-binding protein n=1 Tax=Nocardia sp. NPDC056611 TaxID=3345877 RepID=UPI003672BD50